MTDITNVFLEPANATHRQYEALRAFYVDGVPSDVAAEAFGYTPGSFRTLCYELRQNPGRQFFIEPLRKRQSSSKAESLKDRVVALRKENLSIYDISDILLREDKIKRTPAAIAALLSREGFARLPRRKDEERPAGARVDPAAVADARQFDLTPRRFQTRFGGLFLFLPYLARMPFDRIVSRAGLPGTKMISAGCAMRSLLALKLFGNARKSHVMSHVFDEGLAFFAALPVSPKRSFLTEYSCRIEPDCHVKLMRYWFDAVGELGLERGVSFDLDFHNIPFHGEAALVEKHYVSKRSRRQKGILAFLARDADKAVFCYANADLRKQDQNDEVLEFVKYWKKRTGRFPNELVFDSKLTTYENLNALNKKDIRFITLRRRSRKMVEQLRASPMSAWKRIRLENVSREYRTPRICDCQIQLKGYKGPIRQIAIADLGHEDPTLLLTNYLRRSAAKLVDRYARRMVIENGIADGIDFFHMDALSSAVALKVDIDLQLTLMASSLYRILGVEIGRGYEVAKSRHIFRDFIEASATVTIEPDAVQVRFAKRAHNPLLLAAGFDKVDVPVKWWGGKHLRLVFG
jgi:hypothetical protein